MSRALVAVTIFVACLACIGCTVVEQPDSVVRSATATSDVCDTVDMENVSTLIPDNWDKWCDGYMFALDYIPDNRDVCSGFWDTADTELLRTLMSDDAGSVDRDTAIGMIDAMWTVC